MYECQGRALPQLVVKPDAEIAVADDGILVLPHVADCQLREPQRLIEAKRLEDVRCAYTEFEKAAESIQGTAPELRADDRAASSTCLRRLSPSQPQAWSAMRPLRNATWSGRVFSAG